MTPLRRPVTRLTGATVRERGQRQLVATLSGSILELRCFGLRSTETVDLASLYYAAVKARVQAERAAKSKGRKARKGSTR